MQRLFALLLVICLCFSGVSAQHRCVTHDVYLQNSLQYPTYGQAVQAMYQSASDWASSNGWQKSGGVYQIPVVVHVVYLTPDQNLHDSIIYSQIAVLNEDYRRMNADTLQTRAAFLPVAADAEIEFFLATTDPDGNPTTGITRTSGTPSWGTFSPFDDNVKFDSLGGKNAWPTNRYLNIWVCDLVFGFGILGYAYPPIGTVPNWDPGVAPADSRKQGVVIHYPVFGRNNPLATGPLASVNRGRTTTHEVGHSLGLRHIWGDGDCTMDDGIADTPPAASDAQQICDWLKNTCTETSGPELPDNIENYMDYASDSCMNMFTQGQVSIMRYVLENFRQELVGLPLSVHNQTTANGLVGLFPNPTSDQIQIYLLSADVIITDEIIIGDVHGKICLTTPLSTIDVSNLPVGVYWVRITTNRGEIIQKFIKK